MDNISAINELHIKLGSNESTQYFVGSAVGKIANYDQEIITSKEATQKIMSGVTATKVSVIPTFENIKTAADKSLEVCSNNK